MIYHETENTNPNSNQQIQNPTHISTSSSVISSNSEENKEKDDNSLPNLNIFNKLVLHKKNPITKKIYKDSFIYICGILNGHTTLAKYSFEACNFLFFNPNGKKLYVSIMRSEKCYSSLFKWTPHYFRQIRECLTSSSEHHEREKEKQTDTKKIEENKVEDKKPEENKKDIQNIEENKATKVEIENKEENKNENNLNKNINNQGVQNEEEKIENERSLNKDADINYKNIQINNNGNNTVIINKNNSQNNNDKAKEIKKDIDKKRYYFIINNPIDGATKNDYLEGNYSYNKINLELHFLGKDKDVVAFKLVLEDIVKLDPYYFFISKVVQIDNENETNLLTNEKKKYQQEKEIIELNKTIAETEVKNKIELKENFIKFYLLNRTKIEKKYELEHEYDQRKKGIDMLNQS